MKIRNFIYIGLIISLTFIGIPQILFGQKELSPSEKATISRNADKVVRKFAEALQFKYTFNQITGTDSASNIKRDSIAHCEQNQQYEKILGVLNPKENDKSSFLITNFFFGDTIPFKSGSVVIPETLDENSFADYFSKCFTKVVLSSNMNFGFFKPNDTTTSFQSMEDLYQYLTFDENKFTVRCNLNISDLEADTSYISKPFSDNVSNVIMGIKSGLINNLFLQISWRNFNNPDSYKIVSISEGNPRDIYQKINAEIIYPLNKWIKRFNDYKVLDRKYDNEFYELFNDRSINCIQCNLFLPYGCDSIASKSGYISPQDFVDFLSNSQDQVLDFSVEPLFAEENDSVIVKYNDMIIVKVKPKWKFATSWNSDFNSEGKYQVLPYSVIVELSRNNKFNLFNSGNDNEYQRVKIISIQHDTTKFNIHRPYKGYPFIEPMINLGVTSIPMNSESMFNKYKMDNFSLKSISPGIEINFGYYWGKRSEIKKANYGASIGFAFNRYTQCISMNPVKDSINNITNSVGNHTLLITGENVSQDITFNSFEIFPTFNIKYQSDKNSFYHLAFGIGIVIPTTQNAKVNVGDNVLTYKGRYFVEYPNQTSYSYIVENIHDYGFSQYKVNMNDVERSVDLNPTFMLFVKPSYGMKLNPHTSNYLKIGAFFKVGKTPYNSEASGSEMYSKDQATRGDVLNAFKNGSSGLFLNYGLTLSVQFFGNKTEKAQK